MNSTAIQNRNEAFHINTEKLSLRRKTVYKIIKTYGLVSAQQIKDKMRLGVNQVSGRITELKEMFLIKEEGSVLNRNTNVRNTLYAVTTKDEQVDLVNARYQELVDEKKSLENDYHLGVSEYGLEAIKNRIKKIDKKINVLSKILN